MEESDKYTLLYGIREIVDSQTSIILTRAPNLETRPKSYNSITLNNFLNMSMIVYYNTLILVVWSKALGKAFETQRLG